MNFKKIRLLGDELHLFSLKDTGGWQSDGAESVLLLPSLTADFGVTAYDPFGNERYDYYAAAISAAAYLVDFRGLPLSDIIFETPKGNVEIFNTGRDEFSLKIDKCKLLSTNSVALKGCEVDVLDVFAGARLSLVYTKDAELFDKDSLKGLVTVGASVPDAVVLVGGGEPEISVFSYTAHAKASPTKVLLYAAAAYTEYMRSKRRSTDLFFNECRAIADFSSVTLYIKPKILN